MPKLRRLSGAEVVKILEELGFEVVRIKGSHHVLRRVVDGKKQTIIVPVHGKQVLGPGLLKKLYRDLLRYLKEEELKPHFYTD
jgi:predicted RNA binding protein YcfA (HicA-like mRNA interferase family)